jgi:hypothetical protein
MTAEARLKAAIWVKAHLRRCEVNGITAVIVRHGDDTAGSVLIKLNQFDVGCSVLSPSNRGDGVRVWLRATGAALVAETDADGYIARQVKRDPDLWVIEIEDRRGRHCLDDPVQ